MTYHIYDVMQKGLWSLTYIGYRIMHAVINVIGAMRLAFSGRYEAYNHTMLIYELVDTL